MLFDIFNVFPYYLHVNYWTGKSVRIFSGKQEISGNFRRYDVYSWVWSCIDFLQNSGGGMAGGDELVRVARNKKCYIKISTTEHCARTVLSIHTLGKQNKYTITFFPEKKFYAHLSYFR